MCPLGCMKIPKKMVARCIEFYYERPTDWLDIFVYIGYVSYFQRSDDVYKTLINVGGFTFCHRIGPQIYIKTMKGKVLSPNSYYKHV